MKFALKDQTETLALGASLFRIVKPGSVIFLEGDLGAGKTTLVRGFLRAAGFEGAVKSPTYTLVEEYNLKQTSVIHFDLYRLEDPEELEWVGIRDYVDKNVVWFIEWAQKGKGFLPAADMELRLEVDNECRRGVIVSLTEAGDKIKAGLKLHNPIAKQGDI